jgi:hypothetical protein
VRSRRPSAPDESPVKSARDASLIRLLKAFELVGLQAAFDDQLGPEIELPGGNDLADELHDVLPVLPRLSTRKLTGAEPVAPNAVRKPSG